MAKNESLTHEQILEKREYYIYTHFSQNSFEKIIENHPEYIPFIAANQNITKEIFVKLFKIGNSKVNEILKFNASNRGLNLKELIFSDIVGEILAKYKIDESLAEIMFEAMWKDKTAFDKDVKEVKSAFLAVKRLCGKSTPYAILKELKPKAKQLKIKQYTVEDLEQIKSKKLNERLYKLEILLNSIDYACCFVDFRVIEKAQKEADRLTAILEERKARKRAKSQFNYIDTREDGTELYVDLMKSWGTYDTYLDTVSCDY